MTNWDILIINASTVSYEFSGGRDPGTPVVNITFPDPNQSNGWKDDVDVTIQMPTKRKKGQRVIRSGPIVPNIK